MVALPPDTQRQWGGWAQANIAKPFRKRALKAALASLAAGGTADQAMVAAKQSEISRANYMATSALVLGAISAAIGFFLGGVSILTMFFTLASADQGRRSTERAWQAWTGAGLALVGIAFFVYKLAAR